MAVRNRALENMASDLKLNCSDGAAAACGGVSETEGATAGGKVSETGAAAAGGKVSEAEAGVSEAEGAAAGGGVSETTNEKACDYLRKKLDCPICFCMMKGHINQVNCH